VLLAKYFGGASPKEIGQAFKRLDLDGSGDLSWEEFEAGAAALRAQLEPCFETAEAAVPPPPAPLEPATRALVEAMSTDAGHAELRALFTTLDKDGDGTVTSKEWGKAVTKNKVLLAKYFGGASPKEIGQAFKRLDLDGSGDLSWEEFEAGAAALRAQLEPETADEESLVDEAVRGAVDAVMAAAAPSAEAARCDLVEIEEADDEGAGLVRIYAPVQEDGSVEVDLEHLDGSPASPPRSRRTTAEVGSPPTPVPMFPLDDEGAGLVRICAPVQEDGSVEVDLEHLDGSPASPPRSRRTTAEVGSPPTPVPMFPPPEPATIEDESDAAEARPTVGSEPQPAEAVPAEAVSAPAVATDLVRICAPVQEDGSVEVDLEHLDGSPASPPRSK